jgi:hypothetical protein
MKTPGSAMRKKAEKVAITPRAGDSRKERVIAKIATKVSKM